MDFLPVYKPTEALLVAQEKSFCRASLKEFAPILLKKTELTYDNYVDVFRALLNIEDAIQMAEFAKMVKINVQVKPHIQRANRKKSSKNEELNVLVNSDGLVDSRLPKIQQPNPQKKPKMFSVPITKNALLLTADIDEIVFIDRKGLLKSPLPERKIMALFESGQVETIQRVTRKVIIFPWTNENLITHQQLPKKRFDIIFRSPRISFRLMYLTLELFMKNAALRNYLFPIPDAGTKLHKQLEPKPLDGLILFNEFIGQNAEQLQAVQQILAGPNPRAPYIVFGPPGTGKTTTVVEAILQLYLQNDRNRILVTAGSNSACDTIASRLCEIVESHPRFLDQTNTKKDVIIRLYPYKRMKRVLQTVNPLLLKYSNCKKNSNGRMRSGHEALRKVNLQQYGIVVATLCTVGVLTHLNGPKFTHVFIDEAAASMEPETLLGIVGIKRNNSCHIILSGDYKQLGAVIKSSAAAQLGLGQSMLQRLMMNKLYDEDSRGNYDRTLQTRLIQNYRSHPEIVNIFNKLYYNSTLKAVAPLEKINLAANWSMLPNKKFPIIFQATCGSMEQEDKSTSKLNRQEAEVVCWYLSKLLNEGVDSDTKVKQQDIGVVSPYLAQCRLIKRMVKKRKLTEVEVGSIESYQGREKPIIIASIVTSFKDPRFVSDPQRINVMLSRAQSLMILIGNPVSLSKSQQFKFIVDRCEAHGHRLFYETNMKDELSQLKLNATAAADDSANDSDSDNSSILSIQKPMIHLSV